MLTGAPRPVSPVQPAQRSAGPILLIEDDARMQKVLKRIFDEEGYAVLVAGDGTSGLESFHAHQPAAVVLDLILPEISGRELCRRFKAANSGIPVVVLSAITEVADKVLLLELGADDYVTKPFSPRELLARVQAAMRRVQRPALGEDVVRFGECSVDFLRMIAVRAGEPVTLTALEFKLLRFLSANAGRVLSREALLTDVWGYHAYPTTRTVDNLVLRLRQKLEHDPAHPRHLLTVHGTGYKFMH